MLAEPGRYEICTIVESRQKPNTSTSIRKLFKVLKTKKLHVREGQQLLQIQSMFDDIIFAASTPELCDLFSKIMCSKFKMSMMGKISFFLGLQISQSPRGIFINQSKYALESLKKYGYESCDPVDTPIVEKSKLDEDKEGKAVDPSHYRGMIGTLLYLTASRPDLQFAICIFVKNNAEYIWHIQLLGIDLSQLTDYGSDSNKIPMELDNNRLYCLMLQQRSTFQIQAYRHQVSLHQGASGNADLLTRRILLKPLAKKFEEYWYLSLELLGTCGCAQVELNVCGLSGLAQQRGEAHNGDGRLRCRWRWYISRRVRVQYPGGSGVRREVTTTRERGGTQDRIEVRVGGSTQRRWKYGRERGQHTQVGGRYDGQDIGEGRSWTDIKLDNGSDKGDGDEVAVIQIMYNSADDTLVGRRNMQSLSFLSVFFSVSQRSGFSSVSLSNLHGHFFIVLILVLLTGYPVKVTTDVKGVSGLWRFLTHMEVSLRAQYISVTYMVSLSGYGGMVSTQQEIVHVVEYCHTDRVLEVSYLVSLDNWWTLLVDESLNCVLLIGRGSSQVVNDGHSKVIRRTQWEFSLTIWNITDNTHTQLGRVDTQELCRRNIMWEGGLMRG
ncbi:copia protein [Tanacetum coccineum]